MTRFNSSSNYKMVKYYKSKKISIISNEMTKNQFFDFALF